LFDNSLGQVSSAEVTFDMTRPRTFLSEIIERLLAATLLVVTLPPLLTIAALIHLTSTGPVFVVDESLGRKGLMVRIYRFRTTGSGTQLFKAIGRFLRQYRLDEFPSLWSVVKGDIRLAEALQRIKA
jgi:putative colanic acid biosynthesis UDP-glucose lipid carrier transferase